MAIDGANPQVWNDFSAGRMTNRNLTEMIAASCLIANNVVFLGDEGVAKRPGYTLKRRMDLGGKILGVYDFQRESDMQQFLIVQVQNPNLMYSSLYICSVEPGTDVPILLSATEDPNALFQFIAIDFACYLSNGINSYRIVDNLGVPKLYRWGILSPPDIAAIGSMGGTLTLTFGRQYAYSYVSQITDDQGVTRLSIGAPNSISPSSGSGSAFAPTFPVVASPDPQVTGIWVFSTFDTPADASAVFNFNAALPNANGTFVDDTIDDNLDPTRLAPFTNFAAPAGEIVREYQSRAVLSRIPGALNTAQMSGAEEILLGIPQEAFPVDLIFRIPGGKQAISGGELFNQSEYIGTQDFWFQLSGYDVETFTKQDKVAQPGPVGKRATANTPRHLVWVGKDKKIWAWNGVGEPEDASSVLSKPIYGSLSMEDIADAELTNCVLRYFSWGRYKWLALLANTGAAPSGTFDWIQIWDASFIGKVLEDNTTQMIAEADMWPTDLMTCAELVDDGNKTYLFMGDTAGNVYRFPDGYTDNGKQYTPAWGSAWSGLKVFIGPPFHANPPPEVQKQIIHADLVTDRHDAAASFQLKGLGVTSPDLTLVSYDCPLQTFRTPQGAVPTTARAQLARLKGVSVGYWYRFFIVFPTDDKPATVYRFTVSARPLAALGSK